MTRQALEKFKRTWIGASARLLYRRAQLGGAAKEPPAEPAVLEALALPASSLSLPQISATLAQRVNVESSPLSSLEIFSLDGRRLPCWVESDQHLEDDWLTNPRGYPLYHALFEKICKVGKRVRVLEIGVRTGYVAVAFARATHGPAFYLGVDPNLYVGEGLELAGDTFRRLRDAYPNFDAALIEGYSWEACVQDSLMHSAPFDIIHIDGDHSLRGKLIDLHLCRSLVAPSGLVLVDDWEHVPTIPDAINRAMALGWYKEFSAVSTKRGMGVLSNAQQP